MKKSVLALFLSICSMLTAMAQRGDYDQFFRAIDLVNNRQYLPALQNLDSTAVHPDDLIDFYNYQGICYYGLGKYDAALRSFENILARNPYDPEALVNAANASYRLGDKRSAEKYAKMLIETRTMDAYGYNILGNIRSGMNENRAALGLYQQAWGTDNRVAAFAANLGNTYYQLGNYDSAMYFHQAARNLDAADCDNLLGLAKALEAKNLPDEAIRICDEIVLRDSFYYRAYAERAYAMILKPGYDAFEVERWLQRAIAIQPSSSWAAYTALGDLYYRKGYLQQALSNYNRSLELNANNTLAYSGRGNVYKDSALYGMAIQEYMMSQYLDPTYNYPNLALGEMMTRLNDAGAADMYYGRYVQLAQNRTIAYREVNHSRAFNSLIIGDYDDALRYADLALQADQYDADALNYRGMAMARLGNADSALLYLNRSASADPYDAYVMHNRAYAYAIKGNYEQACIDLKRAYEMDSHIEVDSLLRTVNNKYCRLALVPKREPDLVKMDEVLASVKSKQQALGELQATDRVSGEPLFPVLFHTDIDLIENIYPNPANEEFMIKLKGRTGKPVFVNVPSSNGFTGRQYTLNDQKLSVSVRCQDWQPGTYTVMLISENREIGRKKIVISR